MQVQRLRSAAAARHRPRPTAPAGEQLRQPRTAGHSWAPLGTAGHRGCCRCLAPCLDQPAPGWSAARPAAGSCVLPRAGTWCGDCLGTGRAARGLPALRSPSLITRCWPMPEMRSWSRRGWSENHVGLPDCFGCNVASMLSEHTGVESLSFAMYTLHRAIDTLWKYHGESLEATND